MDKQYTAIISELDSALEPGKSFDVIKRVITVGGGAEGTMYFIDGFVKDEVTEKLMEYFISAESPEQSLHNIPYVEVEMSSDIDRLVLAVLSGATVFAVEGMGAECAIIDTRSYPVRSVKEPENDKVLRGARDGFTETLVFNTALIRRRIRDPRLNMKIKSVGRSTKTDIVICYLEGKADMKFVNRLEKKIETLEINGLAMAQETLAAQLVGRAAWNPFPKVRYTERPDAAASMVLEGSVLVICDNTPSVMVLPVSIFDFLQETDDYCFSPLVGTYLRIVRLIVTILAMFLIPVWYLLVDKNMALPGWLEFIRISEPAALPLLFQVLLAEFAVDGLKLASLNTPDMLSHSFSVVGGLILGDFAVSVGWFTPEVILYIAFVAIAGFSQTSYELGYAIKFVRVGLIILVAAFGVWGLAAGIVLVLLLLLCNRSISGERGYLYPLIPFNGKALARLFFRLSPRKCD